MAANPKHRSMKQVREFEYNELMELGKFWEAQQIADANQEWFEQEAQRWADLAGDANYARQANRDE